MNVDNIQLTTESNLRLISVDRVKELVTRFSQPAHQDTKRLVLYNVEGFLAALDKEL